MIFYLLLKLRENVQNVKFLLLRWFKVLKEKKRIILLYLNTDVTALHH